MTEYDRINRRMDFRDAMLNLAMVLAFVFLAGCIVWGVMQWPGI